MRWSLPSSHCFRGGRRTRCPTRKLRWTRLRRNSAVASCKPFWMREKALVRCAVTSRARSASVRLLRPSRLPRTSPQLQPLRRRLTRCRKQQHGDKPCLRHQSADGCAFLLPIPVAVRRWRRHSSTLRPSRCPGRQGKAARTCSCQAPSANIWKWSMSIRRAPASTIPST